MVVVACAAVPAAAAKVTTPFLRFGLGGGELVGGLAGGGEFLGLLGAGVEGGRGRDGPHPLAELVAFVGEVADVGLGVLELRGPEEGVEGTHLDADTAVHAEGEVDGEPVEDVAAAVAAAGRRRRDGLLVGVDVDAPVRALAGAQHADRAVLLEQADHAAGAGREVGLGVRVGAVTDFFVIVRRVTARPLARPEPGMGAIRGTPP
ncbi:hypothetical protein SHKM778_07890 [Streptomyces sp. KM77-8]|uniref:Secreted protein n=1 Tax=Streptomyces haneummycinicus TaxID=3074435 RepID=A0AAT9HAF0_9ACTN